MQPESEIKVGPFSDDQVQENMHFPVEIAFGEPDFIRGKPVVSTLIEMLQFAATTFRTLDSEDLFA
jgi:hypothetical protein